ncbi:MAG: sialidase [Gemmataceae bacterium]|nr:sialidase [Gemmataceae bacterium]
MMAMTLSLLCIAAEPDSLWQKLQPFTVPPADFSQGINPYPSPLDGVKTKEDWQRKRQQIRQTWNDALGHWPEIIAKPKVEYLVKEQREKVSQSQVKIEVAPGKFTDDAYLLVPEGKGPFPAVVVVYYESLTGIGKKGELRDFAWQLARRGFVTLSVGSDPNSYYPSKENVQLQPLTYHGYVAANCHQILASLPSVDGRLIGIVGHSYGGKWALFGSCLYDKFAAACWCDPGIVFDEKRPSVNYWEPWYLGYEKGKERKRGVITPENPRTGPYKMLMEKGRDLQELHALMAPRPVLVSGGSEDPPRRWQALNHLVAVNRFLGYEGRVAMSNRPTHSPTVESNELIYQFFEYWLKEKKVLGK